MKSTLKFLPFISFVCLFSVCSKVENISPSCSIEILEEDQLHISGDLITVLVETEDPDGNIVNVDLLVNGTVVSFADQFPYLLYWDTQDMDTGQYNLQVVPTDNNGGTSDCSAEVILSDPLALVELPEVELSYPSEISFRSFKVVIQLRSNGGSAITKAGFCYSISPNPTIENNVIHLTDLSIKTQTGRFQNLELDTEYFVRGYAQNIKGISYSNEILVRTAPASLAEIRTYPASNVLEGSAVFEGKIDSEGGLEILEKGFYWKKASETKWSKVIVTGADFRTTLFDLDLVRDYEYKAYAINQVGESNGGKVNFKSGPQYAADFNGNEYYTIRYGDQIWLGRNLKSTHYKNGIAVKDGSHVGDIRGDYTSDYFFTWQDIPENTTYGLMYTFAAVNSPHGICPRGWHVPSSNEWETLFQYAEENYVNADFRKTWSMSGFLRRPDGVYETGPYDSRAITSSQFWWSSSFKNEESGFGGIIYIVRDWELETLVGFYYADGAACIRCIKD